MKLTARVLPLAPRPLELALRLAGEPELVFLWSASGGGASYLAVRPRERSRELDPEPSLAPRPEAGTLFQVPRWIGLLPYEARRGLERAGLGRHPDDRAAPQVCEPIWWRFGAVACIGERVTVVGDDERSVAQLSRQLLAAQARSVAPARLRHLPGEPPAAHAERVRAALELIAAGQIYEVNLARRLDFAVEGHALDLLRGLCRETRPLYAAAWHSPELRVVSTSPELLLDHCADGRLLTFPIKGTRPRGSHRVEDARQAAELDADPKERAELSMVIDVERNDLGRVSELGSVRLSRPPSVFTQGLVWHRGAVIVSRSRRGVSRRELLEAMLPSGSVTGAPKVRAMEIIARLEAERRGLYTGGLGFISHRGDMRLAMAIRSLGIRDGVGHYFTGGGIVADSQPHLEVEETRWKALQLFGRAGFLEG